MTEKLKMLMTETVYNIYHTYINQRAYMLSIHQSVILSVYLKLLRYIIFFSG